MAAPCRTRPVLAHSPSSHPLCCPSLHGKGRHALRAQTMHGQGPSPRAFLCCLTGLMCHAASQCARAQLGRWERPQRTRGQLLLLDAVQAVRHTAEHPRLRTDKHAARPLRAGRCTRTAALVKGPQGAAWHVQGLAALQRSSSSTGPFWPPMAQRNWLGWAWDLEHSRGRGRALLRSATHASCQGSASLTAAQPSALRCFRGNMQCDETPPAKAGRPLVRQARHDYTITGTIGCGTQVTFFSSL